MKSPLPTILLIIGSVKIQEVFSTECVEISHPKTRTFSSLVNYQGNKIPFDPRNSSLGNYVSFNFKEIESLQKNSFLTFDSEHVIKLDLSRKFIKKINDGAFSSLTCLKYLTIQSNLLNELTWKTFDGIGNLAELDLSRNKLRELHAMVFQSVIRLRYLDLSDNLLRKLSPFTFANLSDLQTLNLGRNNFVYMEPEVFNPLISVQTLDLSFNKFNELDYQNWKLQELEILNLSGNFLRSYDTSFSNTFNNLKILNLSSNYLVELNVHGLKKNFQKLTVIDLNHNYWHCDELAEIMHYLIDSRLRIPSRNTTQINELGVDCDNFTQIPIEFSETTTIVSSSRIPLEIKTSTVLGVKIESQMDDLTNKNNEILVEITGVRKLLILSLLFFVICVIVYAIVQVGLCDGLKQKFSRREGYIDTSIQDNYSMLRS